MSAKLLTSRLAPPTSAPSTSSSAMSSRDVVRFHAAAIENAAAVGRVATKPLAQPLPDLRMRLSGLRRRRDTAGSNRPDRLIRDDQLRDLAGREPVEPFLDLSIQDGQRFVALALFQCFADADNRRQPMRRSRRRFSG